MIKQFRSLHPLNIFLLVLVAFVMRLPAMIMPPESLNGNFGELSPRLLLESPLLLHWSPSGQFMVSFALLLLQAFLFNAVVNSHNLIGKSSFMPALLFVVLGSFIPSFGVIGPVSICNFLIIWLLNEFLSMYRRPAVRSLVYNAGLVIGLGTIIYLPFAVFLPLLWIGLMIFRPFNWREWVIGLLGFATVAFFLGFYYYWNDQLANALQIWQVNPSSAPLKAIAYGLFIPLGIITLLSLVQLRQNFFRSVVHIRKSYQLLGVFFLLAVFSASAQLGAEANHYFMAVAPLAVLMAYYFMHAAKRLIYEFLFLSLLGFILFFQFSPSFNFF